MKKTSQSNTKSIDRTNIGPLAFTEIHDQYVNSKTNKVVFTTRKWAEDTGKALIAYSLHPSSLRVEPFHYKLGITRDVWKRLWHVYPELYIALEEAKDILGERRLRGGLGFQTEKLDHSMIIHVHHQYHGDWKEADAYQDERKKAIAKEEGVNGNKEYIVLEKCVDCKEVPTKKEENE